MSPSGSTPINVIDAFTILCICSAFVLVFACFVVHSFGWAKIHNFTLSKTPPLMFHIGSIAATWFFSVCLTISAIAPYLALKLGYVELATKLENFFDSMMQSNAFLLTLIGLFMATTSSIQILRLFVPEPEPGKERCIDCDKLLSADVAEQSEISS